nr:hypothetical protein [uncultured Mediterranean phage uvMED]|tara:strand:- start:290 stop:556 length:267 start_codon:yes stop_codon:yes gene_type:complete
MINLMKHILFYPNVDNILPRSSTEEALQRVETYLPNYKLETFDNFIAIFWEFVTGEIPEQHNFRYSHLWIDALVILAIRFRPYYFYDE